MTRTTAQSLSVNETVNRYKKASEKLRKEVRDNPEESKRFLISAGIAQKSKTNPSGIELVPQLRS